MQACLIPVARLQTDDRLQMYQLLSTYFQGVCPATFEADLEQKNWVLLLREAGELRGFSTLLIYQTQFAATPINVLYSGDTIMHPASWTSSALARSWIRAVNYLRQQVAQYPLYWLLISSGYRTYRFLPLFWQAFYPRYDVLTPPPMADLINFLARQQFGDRFDLATGVVRLPHPQVLGGGLEGIPEERRSNPHIRFFEQKNPGHHQGDELVCLTEIAETNLTTAGRRMWFAPCDLQISS